MKSYPLYLHETDVSQPAVNLLNTDSEPVVGDVIRIEGTRYVVEERVYRLNGELALVLGDGRGKVVKA